MTTIQAFKTKTKSNSAIAKDRIDTSAIAAAVTTPTVDGEYWVYVELQVENIPALYQLISDLAVA